MNTVIDFRDIEPRARHAIFLSLFEGLREGAFFDFLNDHNPGLLGEQLKEMNINNLVWEPIVEGPEVWGVRVFKTQAKDKKNGGGCCGVCGGHN